MIKIHYFNESFCKIEADREILLDIQDNYSFFVDGYKFSYKFKNKMWDGKIKLLNLQTKTFPVGLIPDLKQWAKDSELEIKVDSKYKSETISEQQIMDFLNTLELPFELRDYQIKAIISAIQNQREVVLSATGSGKSLIIYCLMRWFLQDQSNILLIVPTGALVYQMFYDFKEYGFNPDAFIHRIVEGAEKNTRKPITIATWQALYPLAKQDKSGKYFPEWFQKFDIFLGDECHHFQADCLKAISECCTAAKYRFGFTGSLSETKTNEMTLKGIFGNIHRVVSAKELIDKGTLANFKVKCLEINYPDKIKKYFRKTKPSYQDEFKYITLLERRNKMIMKLIASLKGNLAIMYREHNQGKALYDLLREWAKKEGRNIYFFTGEIKASDRNDYRKAVEEDKNAIILATVGAFSTGINIVNLDHLVFASPSKSRIKTMQSIGRILRKSEKNTNATLYDISDNLSIGKYENYTYNHYKIRLELYNKEEFDYTIHKIDWSK